MIHPPKNPRLASFYRDLFRLGIWDPLWRRSTIFVQPSERLRRPLIFTVEERLWSPGVVSAFAQARTPPEARLYRVTFVPPTPVQDAKP